jgi:inosose dehydratase
MDRHLIVRVRVANAPVSWGVDYADDPANAPWARVLDEIVVAGYGYVELGPVGYLPEDPRVLRAELERRGLTPTATFVFEPLHDPKERSRVLAVARRACALLAGCGGTHLVVIDHLAPERMAVAGRPERGRRLTEAEFEELVASIRAVSRVAADHELRAVLHPHVGTYIEHLDEIARALDALDRDEIGLCIDTGHSAYAGIDPVALYRRYAERTDYLHLKDVDASVRARARAEDLDFETAVTSGIFCPLHRGVTDFAALWDALADHGFDGVATVEQDVDPAVPADPLGDARASLRYLAELGSADMSTRVKAFD